MNDDIRDIRLLRAWAHHKGTTYLSPLEKARIELAEAEQQLRALLRRKLAKKNFRPRHAKSIETLDSYIADRLRLIATLAQDL